METLKPYSAHTAQPRINHNGDLPGNGEKALQYALTFFPELKNTKLKIEAGKRIFPIQCRPKWSSFLQRPENRVYKIFISTKTINEFSPLLFENLSHHAQIGFIAHALAKISHFRKCHTGNLFKRFLTYPFPDYKRNWEQAADKLVVEKGLGWELYDWANHFHKQEQESTALAYLNQFHLKPEEILQLIINLEPKRKAPLNYFDFNLN